MAPPASLRDWIALLEREGELVARRHQVDPHLEVIEIVDRTVKADDPALLFTNPKSRHPLLINHFGTERRMRRWSEYRLDAAAAERDGQRAPCSVCCVVDAEHRSQV